ncbi:MAG TPA: hypothetical protein VHZ49_15915 [Methylomirabilota bacterium]|nr:hypothetical protein [Methylomirabilota bacterium]
MRRIASLLIAGALLQAVTATAQSSARVEMTHPARGHEVRVSPAAVVSLSGVEPLVAWSAQEGDDNVLYAARPGGGAPVRVNPAGTSVDSLHQAPGLAAGPRGELYVTWSSRRPVPVGGLFASDLRLSRSLDGGSTWDGHLRLNDDVPSSHSFEGMSVAPDGTVIVAWIETRDGKAATVVTRVSERGTQPGEARRLDTGETCVCCRVDVVAGPGDTVAVMWRKVFADNVRDMVVGVSRDGARTFAAPALVHADRWAIAACPHRGGTVATDARGRLYALWYTEGTQGRPEILFATSSDARRFSAARRLNEATASVPDQARLAVDERGRAVIVWEESTAVRRRVVMRTTVDGGRTLSPTKTLTQAVKAFAPDVVATTGGFVVVWHEEHFPSVKTVIQSITLGESR